MPTKTLVGAVLVVCVATMMGAACSSSDDNGGAGGNGNDVDGSLGNGEGGPGTTEEGGGNPGEDSGGGVTGECSVDSDCDAKMPKTTPAGCAKSQCDTLLHKCHYTAKDTDGDGHFAKACSASLGTIETGDDCDDTDPNTYPGAWDGPPTSEDSGPNAKADRCDKKDNNCDGSPDEGSFPVEGGKKTCACDPDAPTPCYEYSNGVPIDPGTLDGNNAPKGACKKGARTCPAGVPGACVGAIGPGTEACDDIDHDCDGMSGNQGDEVPSAPIYYLDNDGDGFGDKNTPGQQRCTPPGVKWKTSIPNTDCDDTKLTVHPGLSETCDGLDNNCANGIDEGVKIHFCKDADNDTFCTSACTDACVPPTGYRQSSTCSNGADCDDTKIAVHPGAVETCNGVDDNCSGVIDEGVKTTFCLDTDGDSYCLNTCVDACASPGATYRTKTSCTGTLGSDCNDNNQNIKPGIPELCNSVDDNCANGVDEGYNLNAACQAGSPPYGICYRNGTVVCTSSSTSGCSTSGGAPEDYFHKTPSTDSGIVGYPDYNSVWDWNCDNSVTPQPNLLVSGQTYCDNPASVCTKAAQTYGASNCGAGPSGHYYLAMCTPTLAVCGTTAVEVYCMDNCAYWFSNATQVGCK